MKNQNTGKHKNSHCSGYRVFPDGDKCKGCSDCKYGKSKMTIEQAFAKGHSILKIKKKKNK